MFCNGNWIVCKQLPCLTGLIKSRRVGESQTALKALRLISKQGELTSAAVERSRLGNLCKQTAGRSMQEQHRQWDREGSTELVMLAYINRLGLRSCPEGSCWAGC